MRVIRLITAALMLWLTACAVTLVPAGTEPSEPTVAKASFVTADGLRLPWREWLPAGEPKGLVLALHGFNDYSKAFDKVPGAPGVGPFLSERGYAVFAYDQRGFGAGPSAGLWPGRDQLVGDFNAAVRVLQARFPGVPIFALGESMGGAVVMSAMSRPTAPKIDGVILVAPAVWGRASMSIFYRMALWAGARFMPAFRPSGESLGRMASDNIDMLRDNGRDPLFIKRTRLDAVYGLVGLMDEALAAPQRLKGPVLYMYGFHDEIIPQRPSQMAMRALTEANSAAKGAFYENSWHMMLRDKGAATNLEDIIAFMTDPKAPLPSGADKDAVKRLDAAEMKY